MIVICVCSSFFSVTIQWITLRVCSVAEEPSKSLVELCIVCLNGTSFSSTGLCHQGAMTAHCCVLSNNAALSPFQTGTVWAGTALSEERCSDGSASHLDEWFLRKLQAAVWAFQTGRSWTCLWEDKGGCSLFSTQKDKRDFNDKKVLRPAL